jgi:nucleoid DNA-binding protein
MLKRDLIREVADQTGHPARVVRDVLEATREAVFTAVRRGASVMLFGLGKVVISPRAERNARIIRTGEPVLVPAHNAVLLRPSDGLLDAANKA